MALSYNEGKVSDAVIRVLEAREGKGRENVRLPEPRPALKPVTHILELPFGIGRLHAFH